MKKLISILMVVISIFTFSVFFSTENSNQKNDMDQFESNMKYNYKIVLPSKLSNMKEQEVYEKIKVALDKSNGNIYYTRINGETEDCIKYVYATNIQCFSELKLMNGRIFDKSDMESPMFLSTEKISSPDQIGEIATFGGINNFKIATLKTMIGDKYTFGGSCTVTFNYKFNIYY